MLRRVWKPLATTTVLLGTPGYIYYAYKQKQQTFDLSVKVKGPDGKAMISTKVFKLLPLAAIDERLKEGATFESKLRPGGVSWNYSTASYAANDPIEDASSNQIIARDPTDKAGPGDLLFFAVMDGHSGPHTSRLLSKVLINAVVLELSELIKDPSKVMPDSGAFKKWKSLLWPTSSEKPYYTDPKYVSLAVQNAFTKLDSELINAPLHILASSLDQEMIKKRIIPDLSKHPMALTTMHPAVSGGVFLPVLFGCVLNFLSRKLRIDGNP
jgi:pyruvate dehydrogenase phosphatase